ncbi:glycosyl transferase family 2 [Tenacibaculum sp. Bg11-29]|uniref:glycosyltransferase family 2 protein n=1 Tax=Tenacibaculum sp. Bg11-29 TaxID=2058306 RepID=UPI000C33393A|nr:glycosyltransferase family 2 protein [Tenacibaculum sp. Bg11-29]PKH50789.1 glycosyl transferase family 2 [Tenacibaculum sp. Bg11-29]
MILTISIVLYNNKICDIKKLLSDFFSSTIDLYVFIIDNSNENNGDSFKEYKNLEYIHNNENLGYGKAHNIGIRKAIELSSKYHAVVNPDIRLGSNLVDQLILFMDKNKEIGLSSPKVLYPSGKLQFLCKLIPAPKDLIIRRFSPVKKIVKKRDKKYELRNFDYNSNIEIPYVSGCFMFFRTSVLKKVDGFDERFFLYFEDLDLTRRVNELCRTVFFSEAFIYHVYNKESYKNNKVFLYHLVSSIKYFNKWGWIFDKKRKKINKRTLLQIDIKK